MEAKYARILVTIFSLISAGIGIYFVYKSQSMDNRNSAAIFVALGVMLIFNGFNMYRQKDQFRDD